MEPESIAGANCYYLGYCPAEAPWALESALDTAAGFGVNVLRIWTFLEAETGQWGCRFLRFDEAERRVAPVEGADGLGRLDRAVRACADRGIRLILTLTNNWRDYGGMDEYVRWFGGECHEDFYDREEICRAYEDWTRHVVMRYRDEPAVLAWELANEPRRRSGSILPWAARMSAFVKSIDPNHMVAVGDEGWLGQEGVDCEALLRLPAVDFGTYHLYPSHWGRNAAAFGAEWIEAHRAIARRVGKPVVLEEFGLAARPDRDRRYAEWMRAAAAEGGAGALVWMVGGLDPTGARYYDDGFTLYDAAATPELAAEMQILIRSSL